jgi:TolB protein
LSGNSEVYLVNSTGKIVRRLTRNRSIDCSPTWAPNGNEVAFVSDRSMTPQIYVMDRYGGGVRRLSRRGSYNTSPAWSPTGDAIAYVSRDSNVYRLKLASPDGTAEETLFEDFLSYEDPVWAPDGRHLAATVRYGGKPWIVVIDTESGNKRRLVQGESAAWSPLPAGGG